MINRPVGYILYSTFMFLSSSLAHLESEEYLRKRAGKCKAVGQKKCSWKVGLHPFIRIRKDSNTLFSQTLFKNWQRLCLFMIVSRTSFSINSHLAFGKATA